MSELPNDHLTDEQIRACALGRVDDVEFTRIFTHLDACKLCMRRIDEDYGTDALQDRLRQAARNEVGAEVPSVEVLRRGLMAISAGAGLGNSSLSLLWRRDAASSSRAHPPSSTDCATDSEETTTLGRIGPYRLIRKIGEGGMGTVYLAEQEFPVRRAVALKVIKAGMDTPQMVARFRAERQALAVMNHPNITRVFDAGATPEGRPYFVMELIDGIAITEYCAAGKLSLRERLILFSRVCLAIQHAHEKGLIHRDIKPSNVLVSVCDGKPAVKIIDFGVSQSQGAPDDARAATSPGGWIVGTPEYMSPEQAESGQSGVDTRSDVYALGVLLYELLTGGTPLERSWVRTASPSEILQRIQHEAPPMPSRRLTIDEHTARADQPRGRAKPLVKAVRGELDCVVMKALEKDRARRYESASALARDIDRYLAGDLVEAHEPTRLYRFLKFSRKHRSIIAVVTAFAFLLTTAAVVSAVLAVRAHAARTLSEHLRAGAERALRDSERARSQTESIKRFLIEAFRLADPAHGHKDVKVAALLDWEVANLDARFAAAPAIRGELLHVVGETYLNLGLVSKATESLKRAATIREAALGPDHRDTLETRLKLAQALQTSGRVSEAVTLARETHRRYVAVSGPYARETLVCQIILTMTELCLNKPERVIPAAEENARRCAAVLGPDDFETQRARNALGLAYWQSGRGIEAIPWFEAALQGYQAVHQYDSPDAFKARNNLGLAYLAAKRPEEARHVFEKIVEWSNTALGPDHHNTLFYRGNLALALARCGRLDEAITTAEATLPQLESILGPNHRATKIGRRNLKKWRESRERFAAATAKFQMCESDKYLNSAAMLAFRLEYARALAKANRFEDARTAARAVFEGRLRSLGPSHPDTREAWDALAGDLIDWGEVDRSAAEFRALVLETRRSLSDAHPLTRRVAGDYVRFLLIRRRPDPALFLACLKITAARIINTPIGCHWSYSTSGSPPLPGTDRVRPVAFDSAKQVPIYRGAVAVGKGT